MQNVNQPVAFRGICLFFTIFDEALAPDWHQDVILEGQTCVSMNSNRESIAYFISLTQKTINV